MRARETRAAAEQTNIAFLDAGAHNLDELEAIFAELSKQRPLAVVVTAEPFTQEHRSPHSRFHGAQCHSRNVRRGRVR